MTIYFVEIEKEKMIKIGFTAGMVERRIAQLQTGQPLKLTLLGTIPGDRKAEAGLHLEFAKNRRNGEWFISEPEMIGTIQYLISGQLPWYFCKEKAILLKRMEACWETAFAPARDLEEYDTDQCHLGGIVRLEKKIGKYKKDILRFKASIEKPNEWRKYLYTRYDELRKSTLYRYWQYLLAWEAQVS